MENKKKQSKYGLSDIDDYVSEHKTELTRSRLHTWWYNAGKKTRIGTIALFLGALGGATCMSNKLYPSIKDWQDKYNSSEAKRQYTEGQLITTGKEYRITLGEKKKAERRLAEERNKLKILRNKMKKYKSSMSLEDVAACNRDKSGGVGFTRDPATFKTFSEKASQRYLTLGLSDEDNVVKCYERAAFGKELSEVLDETVWSQKDSQSYKNNTLNVSSNNSLLRKNYKGKAPSFIEYGALQEKKLVDFLGGQ